MKTLKTFLFALVLTLGLAGCSKDDAASTEDADSATLDSEWSEGEADTSDAETETPSES